MALFEDIFEDSLPGILIGSIATAILLPLVGGRRMAAGAGVAAGAAGAARGRGRPVLKAAVRGCIAVADRIKEVTAEAREQLADIAAEVRAERRMEAEAVHSEPTPG